MKRIVILALAGMLLAPVAAHPATAGGTPRAADAETQLFAAGATNLSNGFFFPGTVVCLGTDCYGKDQPLMVPRGNDIQFINLDAAAVTNCHQIQSYKRNRRTGLPLFQSECVAGPTTATVKTHLLKPGVYEYQCTTHYGMRGIIEITE